MNNLNKKILVPALTGKFGNWRYYQMILKVEDIVQNFGTIDKPNYRIKAVEEVEEIYSKKGVSDLLQRAYDKNRLKPIKHYILNQNDKYLNNLTIGIFGGNPDWLDINISTLNDKHSTELDEIKKKVGFIELNGNETLFVLDGQHRLKGLRNAYETKPDKIKNEEIVCTLIIHRPTNEGRIRTRRLFSTINRQAKPVSAGENILLDEDDASAIIVRNLIEEYRHFKDKEIIALIKGGNISKGDQDMFSTVVTLWTINENIIEHSKIYPKVDGNIVRVRPSDNSIKEQRQRVFKYWNKFFELFPSALTFINDSKKNRLKYREGGGDFTLRPIAQIALFEILISFDDLNNSNIIKLKNLPLNVNNEFWHYILWDPYKSNMLFNRGLVKNYIKYNIGLNLTPSALKTLKDSYKKNSGELELNLPTPKFQ